MLWSRCQNPGYRTSTHGCWTWKRFQAAKHCFLSSVFRSGAFSFSCFLPSWIALQIGHGCVPSKVWERPAISPTRWLYCTIMPAQAPTCRTAQCPPTICNKAGEQNAIPIRERNRFTKAILSTSKQKINYARMKPFQQKLSGARRRYFPRKNRSESVCFFRADNGSCIGKGSDIRDPGKTAIWARNRSRSFVTKKLGWQLFLWVAWDGYLQMPPPALVARAPSAA
jgi:hypothetical protein